MFGLGLNILGVVKGSNQAATGTVLSSSVTWDASADTYTQSLYVDDYTDLAWDAATDYYTRETGNA